MMDETINNVKLSSSVTISIYQEFIKLKNKVGIANFVKERFTERYVNPLKVFPWRKNGFCTMAICCLMIETLESFWRGWENTRGRDEEGNKKDEFAFHYFFERNKEFKIFHPFANAFYLNIRCGILHQGETTGGWIIQRKGALFNHETKTINATAFHRNLEKALDEYSQLLETEDWNSERWIFLRKKMDAIIDN